MRWIFRTQQIVNYILVIVLTCAAIAWLDREASKPFPVHHDQRLVQLAALQVSANALRPAGHK